MDKLIKNIKRYTKPSYIAGRDENRKLHKDISNFGLTIGQIAVREGGEYNGFTIRAEENMRPILTDERIIRAIEFMREEKLLEASQVLHLNEIRDFGLDLVYYVIVKWLERNDLEIPLELKSKNTLSNKNKEFLNDNNFIKLHQWINTKRYDPLNEKFSIVNIGLSDSKSKKELNSVVPESWIGRMFSSGKELHTEMDKLLQRKGKSPVTFCCIYIMDIIEPNTWLSDYNSINIKQFDPTICITIRYENNNIKSDLFEIKNKLDINKWQNSVKKNMKYIKLTDYFYDDLENIIIACDIDKIFNVEPNYKKYENVGILVSRLQKCIRRGRGCSELLETTIQQLNESKPYNIPEQKFMRVSGTKQICWRLFISTTEDVTPYMPNKNYLSMLDLLCLSIICHIDYKLQFKQTILDKIIYTAQLIQHNDIKGSNWDWNPLGLTKKIESELTLNTPINHQYINCINSYKLALRSLPMMSGDRYMLTNGITKLNTNIKLKELELKSKQILTKFKNNDLALKTRLASYDMHGNPRMILFLQGSLPDIPNEKEMTMNISNLIWDLSSGLNIRTTGLSVGKEYSEYLNIILEIQKYLINGSTYTISNKKQLINKTTKTKYEKSEKITNLKARIGFLLIFGQEIKIKYKNKSYDIIVCDTEETPCKIKPTTSQDREYIEGQDRFLIEQEFAKIMSNPLKIKLPEAPEGFNWIFNTNDIEIKVKLNSSDAQLLRNELFFYVNDIKLNPFDASSLLVPIKNSKPKKMLIPMELFVKYALYVIPLKNIKHFEFNLIMRKVGKIRTESNDNIVYEWKHINKVLKIGSNIWRSLIIKLYDTTGNKFEIGPVDRHGEKMENSINYQYEGTLWRICNMLVMLYPDTIKIGHNDITFLLNKNSSGYRHLMSSLEYLSSTDSTINTKNISKLKVPIINSKLWDHQLNTVNKVIYSILTGKLDETSGRVCGHGDASAVGSGKTLTALSISQKLFAHNYKNKLFNHYAVLIALPTAKLYKTWIDEIKKHTKNFHIVLQHANGELSEKIQWNSLVLSTVGRIREHSLNIPWIFIVIDECLTICNKSALQTQQIWKESINSQYNVYLASATFFRSRIDKLYYMLKILHTELPEKREYLDAILSESIVANIPTKTRKWLTGITKYPLSKKLRVRYNKLLSQKKDYEKLYADLSKLIYDNVNFVLLFEKRLKELENENCSLLIFAQSKIEADDIADKIDNVSRYPEINKKHVVGTVHECGFGVNELAGKFDTILCRPPNYDILPQIKGRLDRPGAKKDILRIEYILLKDTVQEAMLIKLELGNKFRSNHIMPIADFYKLAITFKS